MARTRIPGINIPGINVWSDIFDRTSLAGLTPRAMENIKAAATAAAGAGLTDFVVTAGKGAGHKSHWNGTEFDAKAYKNDKLWTPEQRVAVASGARKAGADRFGLYSFGDGYTGNGSIHIGYSGPGRPKAIWGYLGQTGGANSRAFKNPAEKAFLNGQTPTFEQVPDPFGTDKMQADREARSAVVKAGAAAGAVAPPPRTLAKGSEGMDVSALQMRLANAGLYNGPIDGKFGRGTAEAVRGAERAANLSIDKGVAGPQVQAALAGNMPRYPGAPSDLPGMHTGLPGSYIAPTMANAPQRVADMRSEQMGFGPRVPNNALFPSGGPTPPMPIGAQSLQHPLSRPAVQPLAHPQSNPYLSSAGGQPAPVGPVRSAALPPVSGPRYEALNDPNYISSEPFSRASQLAAQHERAAMSPTLGTKDDVVSRAYAGNGPGRSPSGPAPFNPFSQPQPWGAVADQSVGTLARRLPQGAPPTISRQSFADRFSPSAPSISRQAFQDRFAPPAQTAQQAPQGNGGGFAGFWNSIMGPAGPQTAQARPAPRYDPLSSARMPVSPAPRPATISPDQFNGRFSPMGAVNIPASGIKLASAGNDMAGMIPRSPLGLAGAAGGLVSDEADVPGVTFGQPKVAYTPEKFATPHPMAPPRQLSPARIANINPGKMAGGAIGSMLAGPLGGILGRLLGGQMTGTRQMTVPGTGNARMGTNQSGMGGTGPSWSQPNFNSVSGGSLNASTFNPSTGQGVFINSRGTPMPYSVAPSYGGTFGFPGHGTF